MSCEKEAANEKNLPAQHPDYHRELLDLVESPLSPIALRERLSDYHYNDIAAALGQMTPENRAKLYRILDAEELAGIAEYLDDPSLYFSELTLRKRVDVLSEMEAAAAADYLKDLAKGERATLLELLPREIAEDISLSLSFDEDEIGSIMSTNYVEITADLSIKGAMHSLVAQAADNDNISTIYVVDENHTFYGAIELTDLIIAREGTPLSDLVATSYPYLYAHEQIEDCLERLKKYSEDSIPVLDEENKLLGVITAQDFIHVVDDEMGEDYAMFAGLSEEEDLKEPVLQSVRKRLPWLLVLLGLGLVVSAVVGVFEEVVAQLTLVVCFQSLILDMAGNVGTQSLAVTIRVLMDDQLSGRDKLSLVFKETRVGLINGVLLGTSSFALVGLYLHFLQGQALPMSFAISGCIGVSLMVAMLLSGMVGTLVPLFFKKVHVDPAVASGPLITTINDLVSVITYYGLTWLLLIQLLHITG